MYLHTFFYFMHTFVVKVSFTSFASLQKTFTTRLAMLFIVCIPLFSCVSINVAQGSVLLPSIMWDPRNYLFSCENLTIKVRQSDKLHIVCPNRNLNTRQLEKSPDILSLYEKIYLLDYKQFENFQNCNSTVSAEVSGQQFLLKCENGFRSTMVVFDRDSLEYDLQFLEGKTYYLMSTSERIESKLDQRINGSCAGFPNEGFYKLKLKIYICTQEEIINGECDQCKTLSCYERGCGKWSAWKNSTDFVWDGSKCLQKKTRNCSSKFFQCDGQSEQYRAAASNALCKKRETACSTIQPIPTASAKTFPTCSQNASISIQIVTSPVNVTVTLATTVLSTIATTVVVVSTKIVDNVVQTNVPGNNHTLTTTVHETLTTTVFEKTVTTTKTRTCGNLCTATPTPRAEKVFVDIKYDDKFYITISATIIGAILVGVFVAHACVTYFTSKRDKKPVIRVVGYSSPPVKKADLFSADTHNESYTDDVNRTDETYVSREV